MRHLSKHIFPRYFSFSSGWQHGREAWRSHFSQRLTQPRWPWMRSRRLSAAILTTWTLNPRFPFTCAIDCCWNEMEMLNLNRVITFKRKLGRLKIRGQAYFVTLCHLLHVLWSMTGSSLVFGWFPDFLSSSCSGGWKLAIPEAETRFRFWSSYYKYRCLLIFKHLLLEVILFHICS